MNEVEKRFGNRIGISIKSKTMNRMAKHLNKDILNFDKLINNLLNEHEVI